MRVKNKKTFELSSIKKYKEYERKLWLIPLACLLFIIISPGGQKNFGEFIDNPNFITVIGIIVFLALGTMVLSIIPFLAGKIIIRAGLKTTIQNCTIRSIHDFDYYRDKLTGLSPATISILTDLEIEQKKDVAASILQYENLGLLVEKTDHTYLTTPKYDRCNELNESDRYLIEHLEKGNFDWENDTKWKQLVMSEAISEGYITKRDLPLSGQQEEEDKQQADDYLHHENALSEAMESVVKQQKNENQKQKKNVPIKVRLMKLLFVVIWIFWLCNASPRIAGLQPFYEASSGTDFGERLNILFSQPKLLFALIETYALIISLMVILCYKPTKKSKESKKSKKKRENGSNRGCLVTLLLVLGWGVWVAGAMPRMNQFQAVLETAPEHASLAEQMLFMSQHGLLFECIEVIVLFIYTMFLVVSFFASPFVAGVIAKNMKSIKRTDYGNQMAECIYGMKNFIHDYSNLNEADRRHVVLWEDYLAYAVVLEENEEIVNEIAKTRREVL